MYICARSYCFSPDEIQAGLSSLTLVRSNVETLSTSANTSLRGIQAGYWLQEPSGPLNLSFPRRQPLLKWISDAIVPIVHRTHARI